jgi:cobalt-zinc-cadmium efflux system membrane fusion protein
VAETLRLYGRIVPDAERLRQVRARFPGPVRQVQVRVGERVRAGQVLATVESNESLQVYPVTAPIAGTVITRNVNAGEAAADQPLFAILDDARVWAELSVYPGDRGRLAVGQPVRVRGADGRVEADARIVHIAPFGNAAQAVTVRAVLENAAGLWTPGQFVDAEVTLSRSDAALVVPAAAVQRLGGNDVVFVTDGERFQAVAVELGRRDGQQVEVLSGLAAGARLVVRNSWLVKADIGKSGAAHEH